MAEPIQVTVEELRLKNFRAFKDARLRLSDLTDLVGRNGAGKSSILDAIAFLHEAVADSLENALDRRGGFHNVRRMSLDRFERIGLKRAHLGLALVMSVGLPGRDPVRVLYGFYLSESQDREKPYGLEERLAVAGAWSGFERVGDFFNAPGSKLSPVPPRGNLILPLVGRVDSLWERILETIRGLRAYKLSPAHMADAHEIGERTTLLHNGANAGDVLKALSPRDIDWLCLRLSAITDGITGVHTEALMGRRVLRFVQEPGGMEQTLDGSNVSQGTLRGLGVLLALRQQPAPSLVLIDEIENSLHPSALGVLLDAAVASRDRTRVVLTSHSPEVLSHPSVTGERVRVIEWRDGISQIYRLSPETQAAVNEIDTVGWLLRSNALWTGPEPETCGDDLFTLDGA